MVSWQTIQTILLFFGPWALPRILATYRSIQSTPAAQIRPLPRKTSYALGTLFASGLIAFLSTFPIFSQENVFRLTQSRLQTSGGVIMARLAGLRALTTSDEKLRAALDSGGLNARLLYARYGSAVVRDCPIATPGELDSSFGYLLYATPTIMTPHLLHLVMLAIATSGLLSGREGVRWRTVAAVTGLILGVTEFWFLATYDDRPNQRSTRLGEVDFVHWKVQVWRGLAIAAVDGLLGWIMWLQATGRAFVTPPSSAERIADQARAMDAILAKARGMSVIRNGAVRSSELRKKADDYWAKDAEVMRDILEEPEILQAQVSALNRLDLLAIGKEADQYLDATIGQVRVT